jgi:hypothetical protein
MSGQKSRLGTISGQSSAFREGGSFVRTQRSTKTIYPLEDGPITDNDIGVTDPARGNEVDGIRPR